MAWEKDVLTIPGLISVTDFSGTTGSTNGYGSTAQYLFVKMSAENTVALAAAADCAIGVLQNNPKWATGQAGVGSSVRSFGVSKVMVGAGGALTFGQFVGPDANGCAASRVLTSGGADAGNFWSGIVINGAGVGELATILLFPPQKIQA